ncbi:MAG: rolling circle replication-associated protein [Thermoflexibacteraceae bacterium]
MAQCLTPFFKQDANKVIQPLPCGKCPNCKARRIAGWAFRLQQQEKISHSSQFLTLTYDSKYIPILPNGQTTLDKRHTQLFMKRLRKQNIDKLKYYTAGEYGDKTQRPHYHIILFNADIRTIQNAWQYGNVHYGDVSPASICYALKYINKPDKIPMFEGDKRKPEFQLMSKGIGENYLTQKIIDWHTNDLLNRYFLPDLDGKKIPMPRYYRQKIYTDEQRGLINGNLEWEYNQNYKELTPTEVKQHIAATKQLFKQQKQKSNGNIF